MNIDTRITEHKHLYNEATTFLELIKIIILC